MDSDVKCPDGHDVCIGDNYENYCSGHGLCCLPVHVLDVPICRCYTGWMGKFCNEQSFEFSRRMEMFERAQAIAAFSAVFGVIVITLFVALIFLQIKYYRRRKKLQQNAGNHELTVISKTDAGENGKSFKKSLTIQPGYSWRESVRRAHTNAAHKLKITLSRSLPEDLFQVGLKLAFLGGWKPNHGPIDQQSVTVKAEVKAGTAHRCFSAGPVLGDSSFQAAFDVKDPASASDRPSVVQMPTAAEDTVK